MLYATCPFCSSTLQITEKQLNAKEGLVRCGHCKDIFNARTHLRNITPQPHTNTSHTEDNNKPDTTTNDIPTAIWEQQNSQPKNNTAKPYGLLSIGLLLLLGLQFVFFDQQKLLANPTLRPYIDKLSEKFDLGIPYYKNINELQIISRSLSPHASIKKALHLELSIKNTSHLQQQYPSITFTLVSDDGNHVAKRTFSKDDYLTNSNKNSPFIAQGIIQIELNLQQPTLAASGYEIDFSH